MCRISFPFTGAILLSITVALTTLDTTKSDLTAAHHDGTLVPSHVELDIQEAPPQRKNDKKSNADVEIVPTGAKRLAASAVAAFCGLILIIALSWTFLKGKQETSSERPKVKPQRKIQGKGGGEEWDKKKKKDKETEEEETEEEETEEEETEEEEEDKKEDKKLTAALAGATLGFAIPPLLHTLGEILPALGSLALWMGAKINEDAQEEYKKEDKKADKKKEEEQAAALVGATLGLAIPAIPSLLLLLTDSLLPLGLALLVWNKNNNENENENNNEEIEFD